MGKLSIKSNTLKLIFFVVLIELLGMLSSVFADNIKLKYNALNLPPLSPPDYLFGIVWPLLYLMIAVAGYIIIISNKSRIKFSFNPTLLFWLQLLLNFIWSIVFFNQFYFIGLIIIIFLDLIVLLCIVEFYKVSKLASYLLIPYMLWILFATYLTLGVVILN